MSEMLSSLSLTEVASLISRRQVSATEVLRVCLDRLEAYAEKLCCVAGFDAEAAMVAAARADADLQAGRVRGPLHGVPLAHKDMYYRAGRVSAFGSRIRSTFVPSHTATVLDRLDQAGALDIARLNMVELALGPTGHNEITGTPRNPWKHGPYYWRLVERTGGGRCRTSYLWEPGLGYRRVYQDSSGVLRHCRDQANLWTGELLRRARIGLFVGPSRSPCPNRVRLCAASSDDRRA